MAKNWTPVTVRGEAYPSVAAAARALGLCRSTVDKARATGRLDACGLGVTGHRPMPIIVRGVTYATAIEAAAAVGVKKGAIYQALLRGNLDRIGQRPPYNHARSIPFTIGGLTWPSIRAASIDLGFKPEFIHGAIRRRRKRGMERILAAVMKVKLARERVA